MRLGSALVMSVEALLFDLGGVVIEIDFGRAVATWARGTLPSARGAWYKSGRFAPGGSMDRWVIGSAFDTVFEFDYTVQAEDMRSLYEKAKRD